MNKKALSLEKGVKLGIVGHHFSMVPLSKAVTIAEDMKVDFFELSAIPPEENYGKGEAQIDLSASQKEWVNVKEMFGSSRLGISAIGSYNDFALSEKELQKETCRVLRSCELANFFDVDVVRVFAGDVRGNIGKEALISQIIKCFQRIIPQAAEYGVYLAIENHMHLVNDGPTLLRILKEVSSEWLKVTMDIGNFYWVGASLEETHQYIRMLAPYTVHTHLKNVANVCGERRLVELGDGDIDIEFVVKELLNAKYNRPFTVAFEGDFSSIQTVQDGVKKSLNYMKNVLEKIGGE